MNLTTARSTHLSEQSVYAVRTRHLAVAGACVAALFAATSRCPAATMIYGDYIGAKVMFSDVLEESSTDPVPLFGAPISTSNSLAFTPISFSSSSSNGNADITDSQLSLTMKSAEDSAISAIIIEEAGDYTLSGSGEATTSVGAAVFWTVLEIDGVELPGPLPTGNAKVTFDQGSGDNGGAFQLPEDVGAATIWTGSLEVDMDSFLASQDLTGMVTKIALTLNNTLTTSSSAGTSAFIKKKEAQQVGITVLTEPIPETASLSLLLLLIAFAGLTLRRR